VGEAVPEATSSPLAGARPIEGEGVEGEGVEGEGVEGRCVGGATGASRSTVASRDVTAVADARRDDRPPAVSVVRAALIGLPPSPYRLGQRATSG